MLPLGLILVLKTKYIANIFVIVAFFEFFYYLIVNCCISSQINEIYPGLYYLWPLCEDGSKRDQNIINWWYNESRVTNNILICDKEDENIKCSSIKASIDLYLILMLFRQDLVDNH